MKKQITTFSICASTALVFGLGASVNLAIGKLATSALHPSSTAVLWIIDAYLIVFGCLLIPGGALGDKLGRKRMMLTGLVILAAGSLISAVVPTVALVIAGRGLTGLGAALILPSSLPLMMAAYPPERREHAVAIWTSMTAVGGVLGNVAGGVILQYFDWQILFVVAAPFAIILAIVLAYAAPSVPGHMRRIDAGGSATLIVTVFAVMFAVIEGRALGWTQPVVVGALVLAVVFGIVFVRYELRQAEPLLDPRVFGVPGARAGAIGVCCSFLAMYAMFYFNGQYLMSIKGYSAMVAGFAVVPLALLMALLARVTPKLGQRFGNRAMVVGGLLCLALGLVLLGFCTATTSYPVYLVFLLLIGAGAALSNPALSSAIVSSLPPAQMGTGTGLNSFSREFGGALGLALFGTLVGGMFSHRLSESGMSTDGRDVGAVLRTAGANGAAVRDAFSYATNIGFWVVGGILVVATLIIASWLPGRVAPGAPEGAAAKDKVGVR
ncbi:MFS transporter [Nocardia sp. NBC_01499]